MILVRLQWSYIHSTQYSINYTHHTHAYGICKKIFVLIYRLISLQRLFWIFMNKLLSRMQIFIFPTRAHKKKYSVKCTQINLGNLKHNLSLLFFMHCLEQRFVFLLLFLLLFVCILFFSDGLSAAKKIIQFQFEFLLEQVLFYFFIINKHIKKIENAKAQIQIHRYSIDA